jgi:hypothetical protein
LFLFLMSREKEMCACDVRHVTSVGYPRLTTGIPMGKPAGMETHGSELPIITGLHGSEFLFWVLRVLATGTRETKVLFIHFTN